MMVRAVPLALVLLAWASATPLALAEPPVSEPKPPTPPPTVRTASWLANAPFIPIPKITTDPNSGTTVGVIPTWLETNDEHHIDRIIAPDLQHNPYFGWGAHGRLLDYPSDDVQRSVVVGISERVQRKADLEYDIGRLREHRWSFTTSVVYDRDGTPRFWGIGNNSTGMDQTSYTAEQELAQALFGLNFTKALQLQYTLRWKQVNVLPGTLASIPPIQKLFPGTLGTRHELLNRLSIIYDSRNSLSVPNRGMSWFGMSLYSEADVDGTLFWPIRKSTTVAAHVGLRYLPSAQHVAFWELSSVGGDRSFVGGAQPLRGFGAGRFTDRNALSYSVELRQDVFGLDLFRTRIELEVSPFVELGKVFARLSTSLVSNLHRVYGVGFRGIARPFIVGYVDLGYGQEGAAVFTGIDYPF